MSIEELVPRPESFEVFRRDRLKFIPDKSGCYVLTTFTRVVLYVGLSVNLRRRIGEHLDSKEKTNATELGRAVLVHWLASNDLNKIERTWLNIHIASEGCMPVLNQAYSPTST